MSLQTWKDEFYPIPAQDVAKDPVLASQHSLRKWIGLRSTNLGKHGLHVLTRSIAENGDDSVRLNISDSSCALCVHYYPRDETLQSFRCANCPLALARAVDGIPVPCDSLGKGEARSPWGEWQSLHNPEPMIGWLMKTVLLAEAAQPQLDLIHHPESRDDYIRACYAMEYEARRRDGGGDFAGNYGKALSHLAKAYYHSDCDNENMLREQFAPVFIHFFNEWMKQKKY